MSSSQLCAAPATGTYLEGLAPVAYLELNQTPNASVILSNGSVLTKSSSFPGDFPTLISGPNGWTGSGWDFSQCDGGYLLDVDTAMAAVGNLNTTDGMTVSFWAKGTYSGVTSRIMAGSFDIGTSSTGFYAGTNDYKNAQTPNSVLTWDDDWHHIAVTVDFNALKDSIIIYQDGVLVGSRDAVYLNSMNSSVGNDWTFGARNSATTGFDYGALAGIAVFDRFLTEYEVNAITAGPVFAGLDQTVSITDSISVDGNVTTGAASTWSFVSGPSAVVFGDTSSADTTIEVTSTGEYVLMLSSGALSSTVTITVLANQTPIVVAGNGVTLSTSNMAMTLSGTVEDLSIPSGGTLTSEWSVVSAPLGGNAIFDNSNAPETDVTFTLAGLYRLRLSATDGELSSNDEISVLIEDGDVQSYVRFLRPTVFLSFDRPAESLPSAQLDFTGSTGYLVRYPENGLPQLDQGARSYTGYGWDFDQTDSDVEIINGEHLRNIHLKEYPARSLSYWFKANDSSAEGYLSNVFGLERYDNGIISSRSYGSEFSILDHSTATGSWHHVVVVLESTSEEFVRKFYVDGVLVDQATDASPSLWWEWGSTEIRHPIYVASRGRSGEVDSFGGLLDDFALFDYALTQEDVSYLYNGPTSEDLALLSQQDVVSIDAGENHYIELPASYTVALFGAAPSATGLTPSWRLVEGDGTVSFSNSNSLSTSATFTSIEDDEDGSYSRFILELSLKSDTGKVMVADEVTVLFYPDRSPDIRTLSSNPAPGEHPRIFFTMADLPELRTKATTAPMVIRALEAMQVDVDGLDNPSNTYGAFYQKLKNGESISVETVYGDNAGGIFKVIAEAAYIALLGTGGVADTAKLTELATAFTTAARDVATWYEPAYTNALVHDVNWALGLSYDLLYNWMDDAARDDVRALLSRMTSHRSSSGANLLVRYNSTNWAGYHDHILTAALAIEGEEGYDEGVLDSVSRANAEFMTQYGVFDSGFPHEGYAYYTFGMTWHSVADYSTLRRDGQENLHETTRFYQSIEAALRLMDPDGSTIRSHHDVVEGASGSGALTGMPRHILIAKHMWPNDRMVDFVYAKLLDSFLLTQDRYFDVFHAIFGEAVTYPSQTLNQAAGSIEPNIFCPDRGLVTARNEWEDNGLRFEFRCRQDKYWLGHGHSDVNSFELWSHGKEWIVDRGKFAGTLSDVASTIFIDDSGACSGNNYRWPALPGQFVAFSETDTETIAVGDSRLFYTYSKGAPATNPASFKVTDHGLMWSDFYFPRSGFTMPDWMAVTPYDLNGYGNTDGVYSMLPIKFAYRTTLLTKGDDPYVIIVDDIQKDDALHDYTWIANTVVNDLVEVESQTNDKLILRYVGEENSGARLLVQVLEASGQTGDVYLDKTDVELGVERIEASRIKIESSQVLKPNFKVLLFPFMKDDPLPEVQWNANGNTVSIVTASGTRQFYFDLGDDGRTRILAETPAVEVSDSSVNLDAVIGHNPSTPVNHQFSLSSNLSIAQNWTASSDQSWLTLSATSGVLAANGTLNLTASLGNAVHGFAPGNYTATITFSSDQDAFDRVMTVFVSVIEPYSISPTSSVIDVVIGQVEPLSRVFTVSSSLPEPQSWTASSNQSWLSLSATSGTISSNGTLDLVASLDNTVFSLAEGSYQATITFDSVARSASSQMTVTINVAPAQVHTPTEVFSNSNTFDLDYKQLTFVPSGGSYRVYMDTVTELPSSLDSAEEIQGLPTVNSNFGGRDDGHWTRTPAWTNAPLIGGVAISDIHIGTNGFISFDATVRYGYQNIGESNHFGTRQVSVFWRDYDGTNKGEYYYEFIAGDRAIVTFEDIPNYGSSNSNTAQVELFDDGSGIIRITFLQVDTTNPIVGVSGGTGTPSGWSDDMINFSELSAYPAPVALPVLSLLLIDETTSESSDPLDPALLRIVSDVVLTSSLSVNLNLSGDASSADYTGTLMQGAHEMSSGLSQLDLSAQAFDDSTAEGMETLDVTLIAGSGYVIGSALSVSISLLDDPYDDWRMTNGAVAVADDEDGDGDGVPMLIEYALGIDPNTIDKGYTVYSDLNQNEITITLDNPIAAGVDLTAEWCVDMTTWRSDNVVVDGQEIRITGFTGGRVFVRLSGVRQ